MENSSGNRHNYNATCEEDEFMVAADFTLYSNPINKMLYRPVNAEPEPPPSTSSSSSSPPSAPQAAVKPAPEPASSPAAASASSTSGDNETAKTNETTEEIHHHKRHQHDNADEWIASDMTKYESPLADLEREGFDRDAAAAAVNRKTKTDTPPGE